MVLYQSVLYEGLVLFSLGFNFIEKHVVGIYELMLGEDNQADQARAMQQQMPGGASPQLMDEQKAFKAGFTTFLVNLSF